MLSNTYSWIFDTHPPPRNANNIDPYTFITLFSGKSDTPPSVRYVTLEWPLMSRCRLCNLSFSIQMLSYCLSIHRICPVCLRGSRGGRPPAGQRSGRRRQSGQPQGVVSNGRLPQGSRQGRQVARQTRHAVPVGPGVRALHRDRNW